MSFHELLGQQRTLLEELDQLQEAVADLTALLASAAADEDEEWGEWGERREQLAWLHRQQTGARVALGEIERALLAFMTDEPERD